MAWFKGAAGVCRLTVQCSCEPRTVVAYADRELLHCLVNGLSDKDIRNQVMGKVEVMDLENTVRFIEAKEAGKNPTIILIVVLYVMVMTVVLCKCT